MATSPTSGTTAKGSGIAWDKLPWTTIFAGIILILVAVVGGIVVLAGDSLAFEDYVKALSDLAVGVGLVAVGRGINKAGAHIGKDEESR